MHEVISIIDPIRNILFAISRRILRLSVIDGIKGNIYPNLN